MEARPPAATHGWPCTRCQARGRTPGMEGTAGKRQVSGRRDPQHRAIPARLGQEAHVAQGRASSRRRPRCSVLRIKRSLVNSRLATICWGVTNPLDETNAVPDPARGPRRALAGRFAVRHQSCVRPLRRTHGESSLKAPPRPKPKAGTDDEGAAGARPHHGRYRWLG